MNSLGVDFCIAGGILRVKSEVMAVELLKKDSPLRFFYLCSKGGCNKPPTVSKQPDEQWVIIDFTGADVSIKQAVTDLLSPLKEKYAGRILGEVTCLMRYSMMQGANFTKFGF